MRKTRICIACKRVHNRSDRLCWECRNSAALRTLRDRIGELEQRNRDLERELAAAHEAQTAPRVAVERPRDVSLWWYHERDLISSGSATPRERAEANQLPVQTYLERIYGLPQAWRGGILCEG